MRIGKRQILNDLNSILSSRLTENLQDIILFGSQASGKSHKNSDYDILIVLKQRVDWKKEREISDLCYEIDLKYNVITDTHIISENEFSSLRGKQPIFTNALSNGVHV